MNNPFTLNYTYHVILNQLFMNLLSLKAKEKK